jgi:hypothetical protein
MTTNQIAWINAQETRRSNLAKESETHRANIVAEAENFRSHTANEAQKRDELRETVRSNKERELENIRHNRVSENLALSNLNEVKRANQAKEYETYRNNVADLAYRRGAKRADIALEYKQHVDKDLLHRAEIAEMRRHNKVNEKLTFAKTGVEGAKAITSLVGLIS